jgi:DNA primase large subunit
MTPVHARYPFLEAAREAVGAADVTLQALIERDDPAVDRARERVERALIEGTVTSETPQQWDPREELLSYPIARVIVSLLGVRAAVEKYAVAEAATARERFEADLGGQGDLRSLDRPRLSRAQLLREFDIADEVRPIRSSETDPAERGGRPDADGFRVGVTAYLRLSDSDWGDEWRLALRELADGEVWVRRAELYRMLQEAVRRRVVEGLPFDVRGSGGGEAIADALSTEVDALRELLSDHAPVTVPDVIEPALFPPCIQSLADRARSGNTLDPHSAFTLQAFCAELGMDAAAVADLQGTDDAEPIEYRLAFLDDDGRSQYPAPTCATVKAYGDCPGPNERCERIHSPLAYYADAVADAGADANADTDGDGPGGSPDGDPTAEPTAAVDTAEDAPE